MEPFGGRAVGCAERRAAEVAERGGDAGARRLDGGAVGRRAQRRRRRLHRRQLEPGIEAGGGGAAADDGAGVDVDGEDGWVERRAELSEEGRGHADHEGLHGVGEQRLSVAVDPLGQQRDGDAAEGKRRDDTGEGLGGGEEDGRVRRVEQDALLEEDGEEEREQPRRVAAQPREQQPERAGEL